MMREGVVNGRERCRHRSIRHPGVDDRQTVRRQRANDLERLLERREVVDVIHCAITATLAFQRAAYSTPGEALRPYANATNPAPRIESTRIPDVGGRSSIGCGL